MKVKKKRKKLLLQSALVLLPVFFVLIAAVSLIMYHSVVNSFLEAQNTNMDLTLSRSYDGIVKNNIEDDWFKTWCIDSWEKDPSIMELSESENNELLEKFLEYSDGKESVIGTKEFVDGLTPNVQRYYLRFPIVPKNNALLRVQCFGNFDVFTPGGEHVRFERSKAKEMFAYLIHKQGTSCTSREIAAVLFEDEPYDEKNQNLMQTYIYTGSHETGDPEYRSTARYGPTKA